MDKTKDRRFPEIHLHVLKTIVFTRDYKSAQAAAAKTGLTVSAIARQISDLEEKLGVKLFERHARGMRPTKEGELYAEAAERIIAELDRVGSQLEPAGSEMRGHVRVFISEVLVDRLLKEIGRLTEVHPRITVKVTIALADPTRKALLQGQADIGYIFGLRSHRDLEFVARHDHPLVAVVRPDHELAEFEGGMIKPEKLLKPGYRLVLPPTTYRTRYIFEALLAKTSRKKLENDIQLEINSLHHLKQYVIEQNAVTVLPALLATRDKKKSPSFVTINLDSDGDEMTSLSLCRPRNRVLNPAAQTLLTRLAGAFKTWTAGL